MSFIRLQNCSYTYDERGAQPVPALRGIDLEITEGEYACILGTNGSGKSTLACHLNGILKPSVGQVWVDGRSTADPGATVFIRSRVGLVFQSPEDQMVATVVEEDVAFGPENLGLPEDSLPGLVRGALERVGMWELRGRPPQHLSAGQQQRVAIAGVLAMNPRCLVLDEATALLDPSGAEDVLEILDRLHEGGITIVSISHRMQEAARAQRLVVLHNGRVAMDGAPVDVFSSPELEGLGLRPPAVFGISERLRGDYPDLANGVFTADELAEALSALSSVRSGGREPASESRPAGSAGGSVRPRASLGDGGRRADRSAAAILVESLSHTYHPDTPYSQTSLREVTLHVLEGEIVALLGPTGSGKSTLLQHFNGIILPESGRVTVLGQELHDPETDPRTLRFRVGLVFQRPEEQLFERYVGDDVAYGPRLAGLGGAELRRRVQRAMETVGLDFGAYKDRLTMSLSSGERRRAGLAGVLVLEPEILVLDEPTAGLDPHTRDELIERFLALRAGGTTIVIATHDMDEAAALADRVYVLEDGAVRIEGEAEDVLSAAEDLSALGLRTPTPVALMAALRRRGWKVPLPVLRMDEAEDAIREHLARTDSNAGGSDEQV